MIRKIAELPGILRNKTLSRDELRALQDRKLRALIAHAWERVPYYRSLFQSAGISPGDIRTVDDLNRIPVTTKNNIREAGLEKIVAGGISPGSCHRIETSGSTGQPFTVYLTPHDLRTRQLVEFRSLLSVGFRPLDRLSVLGPDPPHSIRLHERLGLYRSENISALLPVEEQIRRLHRMRPTVFWAYPTVLRALVHGEEDKLKTILQPRILITSAECMDAVLKDRVRSIWKDAGVFNFYGTAEVGRIAVECAAHQGLHVNADHLIVELPEDSPQARFRETAGIVVTALNAFAMPFIRYHLGDVTGWVGGKCSCGSSFPLLDHVQGREDEMLELPSGKLLSPFGLQFILRRYRQIDQFRFIQRSPGRLVIQLAVREDFPPELVSKIKEDCLQHLRESVHVETEIVPFIRSHGKFRTFINLKERPDAAVS